MTISLSEARNIINALKTGVIPNANLDLLNVGRDKEIKEFQRCLSYTAEGDGCVKFICGEYGSGKSFLINHLRQTAIKSGFIVSNMVINGGVRLYSFDNIYYHLMHNLNISLEAHFGTDFEGLFDVWINKLRNNEDRMMAANKIKNVVSTLNNYNSSFARVFLTYIKARIAQDSELSNAAAAWIKGEPNIPVALKTRLEVKGEVDAKNAIDFLKAFIKLITLIGYTGIVILIDELELIMNIRSDFRKNCYENLRYIIDSCYSGELNNCFFVFAGTNEVFEDEERGIKTYTALYQRLGESMSKKMSNVSDIRQIIMTLKKLSLEELQILANKIIKIHIQIYAWEPKISNEALRNWALASCNKQNSNVSPVNTRLFITKLIEVLDIIEQNPNNNTFNTELKVVNKNGYNTFVNTFTKVL